MFSLRKYVARELKTWSPTHFVIDAVVTAMLSPLLALVIEMTTHIGCYIVITLLVFIATTLAIILYRKEQDYGRLQILDETDERNIEGSRVAYSVQVHNPSECEPCPVVVDIIDIQPRQNDIILPVRLRVLGMQPDANGEVRIAPHATVMAVVAEYEIGSHSFAMGSAVLAALAKHDDAIELLVCAHSVRASTTRTFILKKYGLLGQLLVKPTGE